MKTLIIKVYGFAKSKPCEYVTKTFYVRDEAEFAEQVYHWEIENEIFEWSRSVIR